MYKFGLANLRKRYAAAECWRRNSTPNNRCFIRMSIPGNGEEVHCFRDASEMTIQNTLYMVRYLTNTHRDNLYVFNDYGTELEDPRSVMQHGLSYRCKRR